VDYFFLKNGDTVLALTPNLGGYSAPPTVTQWVPLLDARGVGDRADNAPSVHSPHLKTLLPAGEACHV
jgi:hypothetical protein